MTAFKLVPIGVVAVAGLMLVAMAVPSSVSSDEMDLAVVGRFPVQYQGRIMPLDTVARHHLLIISGGRQTYATGQKGAFGPKSAPAIQWLLEVMSGSEAVDGLKFIRIDDPAILQYLQLEKRPGSYRYSPTEIEEKLDRHRTEVKKIVDKAKADIPPTEFEASLLATRGHLQTVASLRAFAFPGMVPDPDNPTLWLSLGQLDEQLIPQFRMQAMVEGAAVIN